VARPPSRITAGFFSSIGLKGLFIISPEGNTALNCCVVVLSLILLSLTLLLVEERITRSVMLSLQAGVKVAQ
jgi:hypothetical protein